MSWQKEVDGIEQRKRLAQELGGQEAIARQHVQVFVGRVPCALNEQDE